jgi:hypothetical protein
MTRSSGSIEVYLEVGRKRAFAGALDWPGWCRSGRDEPAALQALLDAGPRYARAVAPARASFRPPADAAAFAVVERLAGNATTDFGAPDAAPSGDARPLDAAALRRARALLEALWGAFDAAVAAAAGEALRKGPRGGGRDVAGIVRHVLGADAGYLGRLGWTAPTGDAPDLDGALALTRRAILDALEAGARGELPERGPRGGARWPPRYFVRRVAWHVLDHAWEIEDRLRPRSAAPRP